MVCICRIPKGGWPCHLSTSLLRVLGGDYDVIRSIAAVVTVANATNANDWSSKATYW